MSVNFTGKPDKILAAAGTVVGGVAGGAGGAVSTGSVLATLGSAAAAAAPFVVGAAIGVGLVYGATKLFGKK